MCDLESFHLTQRLNILIFCRHESVTFYVLIPTSKGVLVVNDAKAAAMFTNRCYFFSALDFIFLLLPARVISLCNPPCIYLVTLLT